MKLSRYSVFVEDQEKVLAVNLLSRAVLTISPGIHQQLTGHEGRLQELAGEEPELMAYLQEQLFLIEDTVDELAYLKDKVQAARYDPDELGLVIAPTMGCNFKCHYCFENKSKTVLDESSQEKLIALVKESLPGKKRLSIQWFGGEPLLAPQLLENLSKHFIALAREHKVHYSASMTSNGYYMDRAMAQNLKEWGITKVQVTLEGDRTFHNKVRTDSNRTNSFDVILANIKDASEFIKVDLRIHVAPYNTEGVFELVRSLAEQGYQKYVSVLYFAPLFSYKVDEEVKFKHDDRRHFTIANFAAMEVELYRLSTSLGFPPPDIFKESFSVCTAVRDNTLCVDASGDLYKCYFELNQPHLSVGNLTTGPVMNERHQEWLDHRIDRDEDCRNCQVLPVCFGGCTRKWQENAAKDSICNTLKHNLKDMTRLMFS